MAAETTSIGHRRCDDCGRPIEIGEIHWRVYMSPPCKQAVYIFCGECRLFQSDNLATWETVSHGSARWYRAVADRP